MNNEPVAWMNRLGRLEYEQGNGFEIPLYTHPVKELTDEEILKEAEGYGMGEKFIQDAPLFHAIKFSRAILRKAQEK